jgi:type I restriction enzyme S subunit
MVGVGMSKFIELNEIAEIYSGGTPARNKSEYWSGNIPWISSSDLVEGNINKINIRYYINEEAVKFSATRIIPKDSVLVVSRVGVGKVAINKVSLCTSQDFQSIVLKGTKKYLNTYLALYIKNNIHKLISTNQGTSIKGFQKKELEKLKILNLSYEEQKAIAKTLQKWDEAIEKTESLIKAKQKQFKWLFCKLIIDASEIDNWHSESLQKLCKIKKGKQLNRNELENFGGYPAWNGGVMPSGYTDAWNTEETTVIISEGGNSCGFVNYVKEKFWCGGHCYAISDLSTKINTEFLYYFLKANEKRIMLLRVGSGLPNIQKKDIDGFDVKYPSLEEQKSIAQTLNNVQNEIKLLQELLTKYQDQKRGLMQKLLTGKVRINNKRES